jgi:hypothetical protein
MSSIQGKLVFVLGKIKEPLILNNFSCGFWVETVTVNVKLSLSVYVAIQVTGPALLILMCHFTILHHSSFDNIVVRAQHDFVPKADNLAHPTKMHGFTA